MIGLMANQKTLKDKTIKIASDPKYDGYQRGLASMVYKFLIKSLVGMALLLSQITNSQMNLIGRLLENLRNEKFIHLLETIFGMVDLADTQSLSIYKRRIKYLLCVIDLFSKYAWVVPLKDKRGINIFNAFQKIISKGRN